MRRDWKVEVECEEEADPAEADGFLRVLRERMERTLLLDAEEPKKVSLGDYLKLVALIESARRSSGELRREVIVRWEDPSGEETEDAA